MQRSVVALPQPAAGSGASYFLPEAVYGQLLAVTFKLTTSSTAATRVPTVTVTGGDGVAICAVAAGESQVASKSGVLWTFAAGLGEWDAATGAVSGPLPPLVLDAGDTVVVGVDAIDTGDQLTNVRVVLLTAPVRDDG